MVKDSAERRRTRTRVIVGKATADIFMQCWLQILGRGKGRDESESSEKERGSVLDERIRESFALSKRQKDNQKGIYTRFPPLRPPPIFVCTITEYKSIGVFI